LVRTYCAAADDDALELWSDDPEARVRHPVTVVEPLADRLAPGEDGSVGG
jgi:hypothetical protein